MPSTKVYSVGLVALSVVAVLFAVLWLIYWDAYKNMLDGYGKLLNRYADTLISLGENSGTATLLPGHYLAIPIVIPPDDTGFVNVAVISKQSSVKAYIIDISQYAEWCAHKSFSSYYLYKEGAYIDSKVALKPGIYFVVIINPNITPTSISYTVKTMYESLHDLVTDLVTPRARQRN